MYVQIGSLKDLLFKYNASELLRLGFLDLLLPVNREMEIESPAGPLPVIPDDLTLVQFIFDYKHPLKPIRNPNIPWLVEDVTGRKIGEEEVSVTVDILCETSDMLGYPTS